MSTVTQVDRDERTDFVESASYRWAYFFLAYALLADVAYRAFSRHEASWDLMGLVIAAGVVSTLYKARYQALAHGWVKAAVFAAVVAGTIAALLAWVR